MTKTIRLSDGRDMPALGLGTWKMEGATAIEIVPAAVEAGYRLIDTAAIYGNEEGVGEGLARAPTMPFVTTKLWNDRQRDAAAALDESLAKLGLDAVDLYLIHWPTPAKNSYVDAWNALIALRDAGKAKSIGVSNFTREHLDRLESETGVVPVLNQVELHPSFQQAELRAYHAQKGIATQSWSPLGRGEALDHPTVKRLAEAHRCSPAALIVAWHLELGLSVIPKASDPDHMRDNLNALDVRLSEEDVAEMAALDDADGRIGPHPNDFNDA